MKIQIHENFSTNFELTEEEKKSLLEEFSQNFTQAHQLMKWIEDPDVPIKDRTEYFPHMCFIFETMHKILGILREANLSEKEIITALNELPF